MNGPLSMSVRRPRPLLTTPNPFTGSLLAVVTVVVLTSILGACASTEETLAGERWRGTAQGQGGEGCVDFKFDIFLHEGGISGWAYTPRRYGTDKWTVSGTYSPGAYVTFGAENSSYGYTGWTGQLTNDKLGIEQSISRNCHIQTRKGTLIRR